MALPHPLISKSEKIMSGAVAFAGTRVPVQALMDYLEEGSRLDDFLEDFPTASREHAVAVLELIRGAPAGADLSRNRGKT
jgi:uncharacterized protein (DUF433 family)